MNQWFKRAFGDDSEEGTEEMARLVPPDNVTPHGAALDFTNILEEAGQLACTTV